MAHGSRRERMSVTPDAKFFLAKFTILLLAFPLFTLFFVRDVVAPALELRRNLGEGLAIVSAVVVVQLILVWSCLEGFRPEQDEREQAVQKKDE